MGKAGFIIGIILLVITLMMPLSSLPAQAAEGPQAAPLNPVFIKFQQNQSEPFYGYIPPHDGLEPLKPNPG